MSLTKFLKEKKDLLLQIAPTKETLVAKCHELLEQIKAIDPKKFEKLNNHFSQNIKKMDLSSKNFFALYSDIATELAHLTQNIHVDAMLDSAKKITTLAAKKTASFAKKTPSKKSPAKKASAKKVVKSTAKKTVTKKSTKKVIKKK